MEQAQAGTRVSLLVQVTAITTLHLQVLAGEQGQTLQQVEVGLTQGLGRAWIQSRLGGVCKLICLYGKYCDKDESFQSLFLVLMRI